MDRSMLEKPQREAVAAAIDAIVEETGNQTKAGVALGVSQSAVYKATKLRQVGPLLLRQVLAHFRIDEDELMARYGKPEPPDERPKLDASDPYPSRALALVAARMVGVSEAACRSIRVMTLAAGSDPPALWWLRAVLNAQELVLPPPQTAAALQPTLANSPQKQERAAQRMEQLEAETRSGRAKHVPPREQKRR